MPGKLSDADVKPSCGALGLLASAYSNSDDEFEDDEILDSKHTKQNSTVTVQIMPAVQMGAATTSIPILSSVVSDVKPEHPQPTPEFKNGKDEPMPMISKPLPVTEVSEVEMLESSYLERNAPIANDQRVEQDKESTEDQTGRDGSITPNISYNKQQFKAVQKAKESDTSDSESDSDISDDSDSSDDSTKVKRRNPPRVKGELLISDLPPIEDLHISVPHEQCEAIGIVKSVIAVDSLVVVESYPNSAALNLDTVLFLDKGDRTLGRIFDVFGPVKQPHYSVRFNSNDHISTRGVQIGMIVYCAPKTEHTSYVLLGQLRLLRGTDASWEDDIEPPPDEVDYSDDEAERGAKNANAGDSTGPGNRVKARKGRGRGRKRTCQDAGTNQGVHYDGNSGPLDQMKTAYNPPYVSGFYPPSMRFRGPGPGYWHYGQGYGYAPGHRFSSMSPTPPRPYQHPSMCGPSFNPRSPSPIHNRMSYSDSRIPNGHYYPPPPPPPELQFPRERPSQQPFSNGHNRNPTPSSHVSFGNYGPPPPPPPPSVSQFPNRLATELSRLSAERLK